MCFFKKKKPVITGNKFFTGEQVYFRRPNRDEREFGWVWDIHQDKEGNITYDIQIGGQCPAVVYGISEDVMKSKQ